VEHVVVVSGGDLGVIALELDKLVAFSSSGPVSLNDVRKLVGGSEGVEVWNVLERLLGPEPGRGAAVVDTLLRDGRSSQYLIATLAGQFREVLQAQVVLQRSGGARHLASELRLPDWRSERLGRQASSVPALLVEGWLRDLQRLDAAIKNGDVDGSAGLRLFALGAARSLMSARPRS